MGNDQNTLKSAFTSGIDAQEIYMFGIKVWPLGGLGPDPSTTYYLNWSPYSSLGTFTIDGRYVSTSVYGNSYSGFYGYIDRWAARSNSWLTSIETNAFMVGESAFDSCTSLNNVSYYGYYIMEQAFHACTSLKTAFLPNCLYVGAGAFAGCSSLSSVTMPGVRYIASNAFNGCPISQLNLDNVDYILDEAFHACPIEVLSLPACTHINPGAFWYCSQLVRVSLPNIKYCAGFSQCSSLSTVYLGNCESINSGTFRNDVLLSTITLETTSVCYLPNSDVFYNTPIRTGSGSIYVPASLVAAYKTANVWKYFSTIIFPIPE